ncbi:hypothetical protein RhiirA1_515752 [Rhizophagus irregularis]|uniref:Uncharacterized protein n=1 Tax=Rhizophagus irregularis TaxID=588596 RepID=A0A2N0RNS1_9GLOM|nr:hypothetical protein RhiirA1_515752 [Rhizophagus irregularis]
MSRQYHVGKSSFQENVHSRICLVGKLLSGKENIESANRSWFEEAALHLNICIKWVEVALCYAYRSVQFDLSIPENIASKQTSEQKNSLKLIEDKPKSKKLYNNKVNYDNNEAEFQYMQRNYIRDDDDNDYETYNSSNLHSKEQDELEIPEILMN